MEQIFPVENICDGNEQGETGDKPAKPMKDASGLFVMEKIIDVEKELSHCSKPQLTDVVIEALDRPKTPAGSETGALTVDIGECPILESELAAPGVLAAVALSPRKRFQASIDLPEVGA